MPPVYTCRVGFEIVTAHTTSPCASVDINFTWRGTPGAFRASGGKGAGWMLPSADTWNEYVGLLGAGEGPELGPGPPVAGGVGKLRAYVNGLIWPVSAAAAETFSWI